MPFISNQLSVHSGSGPILWQLISGNPGGDFSLSVIGVITWSSPVARTSPYIIAVRASNSFSSDVSQFLIFVPLSYNGSVTIINADGFPATSSRPVLVGTYGYFTITGHLSPLTANATVANQPSVFWVRRSDGADFGEVTLISDSTGRVSFTYSLSNNAAGLFYIGLAHPSDPSRSKYSDDFASYAIAASANVEFVGPPNTFSGQAVIRNVGNLPLTRITVTQPASYPPGVSSFQISYPSTIPAFASALVNITAGIPGPIVFDSLQLGVSATYVTTYAVINLKIAVQPPQPLLQISPSSVYHTAPRGTLTYFRFVVENVGAAMTGDLQVRLPNNSPILSLLSEATILSIGPGNSTTIEVAVNIDPSAALAMASGDIIVSNSLVGVSFPFTIDIVSTSKASLTVVCEDELTYFASDHPGVAGAIVSIVSYDNLVSLSAVTNASGNVTFVDIPESYYTIQVQALKHGSYSGVVDLVSPGVTVGAFMPLQVSDSYISSSKRFIYLCQ